MWNGPVCITKSTLPPSRPPEKDPPNESVYKRVQPGFSMEPSRGPPREHFTPFAASKVGNLLANAAFEADISLVRSLLCTGPTPTQPRLDIIHYRDVLGRTPLMFCAFGPDSPECDGRAREEIATLLLNAGARASIADDLGMSPLKWAARAGRPHLVSLLLEALRREGAPDADATYGSGRTALAMAYAFPSFQSMEHRGLPCAC